MAGTKANQTSIKPGEVRNPNGRPKKEQSLTGILNAKMEDLVPGQDKISFKDMLALKLLQLAAQGDLAAIKYCYDRLDGTPTQAVKQVDDEGNSIIPPIQVTFVKPNES
jgi:hypothetical protein